LQADEFNPRPDGVQGKKHLSEHLTHTQIEGYSFHKLSAAELISVSEHLDVCEACSRQVERALDGDAALLALRSGAFGEEEMLFSPGERTHLTPEQTAGYIDELLAGEELQTVRDHLTSCEQCEMAVTDLRVFRDRIAAGLNREYRPSSAVTEDRWRRLLANVPLLFPKPRTLIFGSALAALLLILAGWSILQMLQRGETEVVETPPSPTAPAATPVVSPTQRPGDAPAIVVARLADGGGQVTLDQEGNLSGIDNLSPAYQQMIKGALTNQDLEKSQLLAGLTRPGDSQIRGRDNQDRWFSLIKPVGTVVLSDRPVFRWTRLDGATSYVVEVYDNKFTPVAASPQLIDNSWTAPKSLPRGKIYIWQVKVTKDEQELIFPLPDEPVAKFRILDQARANELGQTRRASAGSHLVMGMLYARDGLLDEAEMEFRALQKANPNSAIARRLLAGVLGMRN
jgi:hypothetical protein